MSRNGAGVYSLPSGNPVVTGTTISSTTYNNTLTDIASALTGSVASDGQTPMTGALAMGSNKITGLADGALVTDVPSISQVLNGSFVYVGTVGGTGDVITLSPSPAIASYAAGQTFRFIAAAANTTNVTVNVSGKGAKAVTKNGTTALVANDILLGALITVTYDGTQFQMVPSTNLLATDSAVIHNTLTTTTGDIIYASSANTPARLAVGAAGTVLVGGTTPSYFTGVSFATGGIQIGSPTGGAKGAGTLNVASGIYDNGTQVKVGWQWLATTSASGSSVTFTGLGTYDVYKVIFEDVVPSGTAFLVTKVSTDGTTYYGGASDYAYTVQGIANAGTDDSGNSAGATYMSLCGATGILSTVSLGGMSGEATYFNLNKTGFRKNMLFNSGNSNNGAVLHGFGQVLNATAIASAVVAVDFELTASATFSSGTFYLYGLRKA